MVDDGANGEETMALYEASRPIRPLDIALAMADQASLNARCIMAGIVEPEVELTPELQTAIGNALLDAFHATEASNDGKAVRIDRILNWAARRKTPAEIALFVGASMIMAHHSDRAHFVGCVLARDSWGAFSSRFGDSVLFKGLMKRALDAI